MGTEPVEGLLVHLVVAEGRFPGQPSAAIGSGEVASRHREGVDQGHLGVEAYLDEQMLPEHLLYGPEVSRLAAEGGAVNSFEGREPLSVVATKVLVEALLGVDPEELPDDFHGKHLGVGEFWLRAALAQLLIFEPVVREAENGRDEGAKIHEQRPPLRSLLAD